MENAKAKGMGIALVLTAGFFLFNPTVAFIDVLPNCIGYLLLLVGLERCADLSEHIFEARRKFRTLLVLGILQPIVCYLIYGVLQGEMFSASEGQLVTVNPYEQPVYVLLASFVLLVLQWYFLIPALKELFLGMDRLAERYGMQGATQEKNGKTRAECMAGLSSFFVISTSLAGFLPELSILTSFENDAENKLFSFDWYDFVFLFRVFCFAVAAVIALVWLISYIRFFASLLRDKEWSAQIQSDYSVRILSQTGMLTVRRLSAAFALLQIGIFFTVSLRLNGYSVVPSAVFAVFALVAIFLMEKTLARTKVGLAVGVALITVSVAQCVANYRYLSFYLPEASLYQPDAYWKFLTVQVLQAAEALFTGLFVFILLRVLFRVAKEHTGAANDEADSSQVSTDASTRSYRELVRQKNMLVAVFTLASVAAVADSVFQLQYPWLWLIGIVLSLIGIILFYSFLHELQTQIQFHYGSNGVNKNK